MTQRAASATWSDSDRVGRRLPRPDPGLIVAALGFMALVVVALFGGRLAPHESIYFVVEHGNDPRPYDPGVVFPFGSDVLGRDIFSLVLAGARATLTIVLLGGLARVAAGVLLAALSSWWRPVRLATESVAELTSAVPATIVALVLVKVLVRSNTDLALFICALLVLGWAGPYRVIRSELDRLANAPFTEGADAVGVRRWHLFRRHYVPHLVPVIAMNASQQVVASLVLLAELGALGVFVGATRIINIEESIRVLRTGPTNSALISEPPEWGGLLANARTLESLWTTRWLILVPGVAFALTGIVVAGIGFVLARRYARRNFTEDLRSPWVLVFVGALVGCFVLSSWLPERYAGAREWATAARSAMAPTSSIDASFAAAGLRPIGGDYAITRESTTIAQTAPATLNVGGTSLTEPWPKNTGELFEPDVRSLVTTGTGGGLVDAPLVFAGRGISQADFPLRPSNPFEAPDISRLVQDYADDYAAVDVRGKVVLLVRFLGVAAPARNPFLNGYSFGPSVDESIGHAISRGAAGVIFVDPALTYYTRAGGSGTFGAGEIRGGLSPYARLESDAPAASIGGVPVIIVSPKAAAPLLASVGLDLSSFYQFDARNSADYRRSAARELGARARLEVPLEVRSASATSYMAEVGNVAAGSGRVLIWAERAPGTSRPLDDVLAALGRTLSPSGVPFVFVDFDPSGDPTANRKLIEQQLGNRRISLVLVLTKLEGTQLRFTTPYGDLIPALDLYADNAGARHEVTRSTAPITALSDIAPLVDTKTVLIEGNGVDGDLRPDATAFIGYLAGRLALGAEELPR